MICGSCGEPIAGTNAENQRHGVHRPEEQRPEGQFPEGLLPEGLLPEGLLPEGQRSEGQRSEGPCPSCGLSPLLDGRYRLDRVVGQGASGITYRAERVADGLTVAIKELPFRRIDSMKTKALFQRESRILRQLNHPGIPACIDDFTAGVGKNLSLYLVQEFIEGQTLTDEQSDSRTREDEVLLIVAELLSILDYLHTLSPPVIHRDIKPNNVMRRASDGALVLIDFGSVRDAVTDPDTGGSTVAGTFGFMAPEQFQSRAEPASDIYGLGAMAVCLLTRREPDTLLDYSNRLDWAPFVKVHPMTRALLDRMLSPDPATRARDAGRLRLDVLAAVDALRREREALHLPHAAPLSSAPERDRPALDLLDGPPPHEWHVEEARSAPLASSAIEEGWGAFASSYGDAARPEHPVKHAPATFDLDIIGHQHRPPGALLPLPDAPATDGATSHTKVIALVFAIFLAFVAMVTFVMVSNPERGEELPQAAPLCNGAPCLPVATGLKGLSFGMSEAQALAALPEIAAATRLDPEVISPDFDALNFNIGQIGQGEPMPGFRLEVATTLGAFPTSCTLDFAVDDALSQMICAMEPLADLTTHVAAEQTLLNTLKGRYGPPTSAHTPDDVQILGVEHKGTWTWSDGEAELEVESRFQSYAMGSVQSSSTLTIANASRAHQKKVSEIKEMIRQKVARQEAERRREEEDRRRQQQELLNKSTKGLGDDL